MKTNLRIILATTAAGLLTGCAGTGLVAQRDSLDPALQKGDVRPVGIPTTARNTGASQGHTVDRAINNLN